VHRGRAALIDLGVDLAHATRMDDLVPPSTDVASSGPRTAPPSRMKAAVYDEYGGPEVVHLEDMDTPQPGVGEVLIEVYATTVASGDWRTRSGTVPEGFGPIGKLMFSGRPKKRVLGTELSGVIAGVGDGVNRFRVGDEVIAFPGAGLGAHAQYIVMPADGKVTKKPVNLSFEEAAAMCFGGSTAMSFIEKGGGLARGQEVLVVGASGSVGAAMVQLATHAGARVTAVCGPANVGWVRELGADVVINYREEDVRQRDTRYDVVVVTAPGTPARAAKELATPTGRVWMVLGSLGDMLRSIFSHRIVAGPANEDPAHLPKLAALAEEGAFRPHIDEVFAFADIVDAHRKVDSGHKSGNVVVRVRG
jgi:NADPH:quinone reductase-like Zn-dependent oxidoreductase